MPYVVMSLRHGKKKQNVGPYVTNEERQTHEGGQETTALERRPSAQSKGKVNDLETEIWRVRRDSEDRDNEISLDVRKLEERVRELEKQSELLCARLTASFRADEMAG